MLAVVVVLITTMPDVGAQLEGGLGQSIYLQGQWAGPYELDMTKDAGGVTWPTTKEIVHSAVLPPVDTATSRKPRVLLQARHDGPGCDCAIPSVGGVDGAGPSPGT